MDWAIRSERVATPAGVRPACIQVRDGVIAAVREYDDPPAGDLVDAGGAVILPGLVDTHVHINEPGRETWEGFWTATRAAAAGGITTLVDMPLNSVPSTTTVSALQQKIEAAHGQCWVDAGFWGGVVPGNAAHLEPLWEAGALGFKCFLTPSGVDEFKHVDETDLREAMPILAGVDAPLLAHAELPCRTTGLQPVRYSSYLASRPREAENQAIALLIRLCREYRTRIHVVHLSSSDALSMLQEARAEGLPVTVETCPHYLHFAAEQIADGATEFKCAPPIRETANQRLLWTALEAGLIDMVASDHSPCPPGMKKRETGDFFQAWGGIASLQLGASIMRAHGVDLVRLPRWMAAAPARLAGLSRKGTIAPGKDADFVLFEPDEEFIVHPDMLHHRHKLTPYAGETLQGVVRATYLRGNKIYERGDFAPNPTGAILKRDASAPLH